MLKSPLQVGFLLSAVPCTCRSELARDEFEGAAFNQTTRVIVNDHRERARPYRKSPLNVGLLITEPSGITPEGLRWDEGFKFVLHRFDYEFYIRGIHDGSARNTSNGDHGLASGTIKKSGNHTAWGVHARLETHGMKMPAHQLAGVWKRDLTEPSIHVLPAFIIERFP